MVMKRSPRSAFCLPSFVSLISSNVLPLCHSIIYDRVSLCVILTVDEAMKINKKLTTANGKQEATIASLKKACGRSALKDQCVGFRGI